MAAKPKSKPKGGRKNRKHGRWKKSPSMQRYVAQGRCAINKARRAKKQKKLEASHAAKRAEAVCTGMQRDERPGSQPVPNRFESDPVYQQPNPFNRTFRGVECANEEAMSELQEGQGPRAVLQKLS